MTDLSKLYPEDPLMRAVQLSVNVKHFLEHDKVGVYLMSRALDMRAAALEALGEVNPNDQDKILQLQWQARIPALFQEWLDEAIANGDSAEEAIELEEQMGM